MHPVRTMLNQIEDFLLADKNNASLLWDILSALRGPDTVDDPTPKNASTTKIRRAAFPRIAERCAADHWTERVIPKASFYDDGHPPVKWNETVLNDCGTHFRIHYMYALLALDAIDQENYSR